ncbi:MAG: carboxylesterase/lipase family protein [Acidobacteriota bacterium]
MNTPNLPASMRQRWPFARRPFLLATLSVSLVGAFLLAAAATQPANAQAPSCLVNTASGPVQGLLRGGTCTYLAIPYAAPPVGNLRWRPPQPRAPWAPSTLNATVAGPACAQINLANAPAGSEDCLMLNIWAPATTMPGRGVPVLVWLHAGAFLGASSNFAANDGRRFAEERGVIVVAPNYRLGAFGWLAHSALASEDPGYPSSGNYGLADQRAALKWVQDHIAAFGGDAGNVTLAGGSAGAISTGLHLVSPASRGLVHRAIFHSGFPTARTETLEVAALQGEAFAAALGCTDRAGLLTCLRSKSRDQVLTALPLATLPGGPQQFSQEPGRVVWGPVVDGLEIPDQPRELFRRGRFSRVPIIIGSTRDDGWTHVDRSFPAGLDALQYERAVRTEFGMDADAVLRLYPASGFPTPKDALAQLTTDAEFACEARRVARVMHHDGAPVYAYAFEYIVGAVNRDRAFHGLDVTLVFGNNFGAPSNHVLTPADLVVFDAMSTYWRRFMETGDPNPRGAPVQWPPYRPDPAQGPVDLTRSDAYFTFGDRLGVNTYLRDQQCNFWESFFFRSVIGAVPAAAR